MSTEQGTAEADTDGWGGAGKPGLAYWLLTFFRMGRVRILAELEGMVAKHPWAADLSRELCLYDRRYRGAQDILRGSAIKKASCSFVWEEHRNTANIALYLMKHRVQLMETAAFRGLYEEQCEWTGDDGLWQMGGSFIANNVSQLVTRLLAKTLERGQVKVRWVPGVGPRWNGTLHLTLKSGLAERSIARAFSGNVGDRLIDRLDNLVAQWREIESFMDASIMGEEFWPTESEQEARGRERADLLIEKLLRSASADERHALNKYGCEALKRRTKDSRVL